QKLKDFLKVPYLSLVVNGHMALELAIQSFNFPEGAEVITTPFTFISTTHAIVRNKLKPVFCDVKESDGTIDPKKIEELITENTSAILPVHVYGNICDVEKIQELAYKYSLKVIYDAAHAFGETYKGQGIGSFGNASVFSFHATKVYHTIEGGAVAVNSKEHYETLFNLKNFGIRGNELVVSVGANAKMNEFAAIMGLCNLKRYEKAIARRKEVCEAYREKLKEISGIRFLTSESVENSNYAYLPVIFEGEFPKNRDEIYEKLAENRIFSRKYFYPLTCDQACFRNKHRNDNLPVARRLAESVLTLPVYEGLTTEDVDYICEIITREGRKERSHEPLSSYSSLFS
ncbi:MAG: DegT/DnrJ/EryC1/StrS family aminotransferase, partial [Selenomonadaceae bacterium]|nr:DegT/DnrJ/EryC1/StrS family aminotransferase [Selenomonadaceae bacterium]